MCSPLLLSTHPVVLMWLLVECVSLLLPPQIPESQAASHVPCKLCMQPYQIFPNFDERGGPRVWMVQMSECCVVQFLPFCSSLPPFLYMIRRLEFWLF